MILTSISVKFNSAVSEYVLKRSAKRKKTKKPCCRLWMPALSLPGQQQQRFQATMDSLAPVLQAPRASPWLITSILDPWIQEAPEDPRWSPDPKLKVLKKLVSCADKRIWSIKWGPCSTPWLEMNVKTASKRSLINIQLKR